MFTIVRNDEEIFQADKKEEIMTLVEQAILGILHDESAISQYSSVQRIVLVTDDEKRSLSMIAETISADFASMYEGDNIKLEYVIAE
jgi:hypothetical protein